MAGFRFLEIAADLDMAGLVWQPEIGDEISQRKKPEQVSILVDPQGMTPKELRAVFLWLPSVEQLVLQFESRQAVLFHAGLDLNETSLKYKTIIQARERQIEVSGESLRIAMGLALRDLLLGSGADTFN